MSDGVGDMASMAVTPLGALFDVSFTLDPDGGTYRASGSAHLPAEFGGSFVESSPMEGRDGFAAWRTDFAADVALSGAGVAQWDDDAFVADVLGTTQVEAWMLAGQGLRFTDATITVPRHRDPAMATLPGGHRTTHPHDRRGRSLFWHGHHN